MGKDEKITVKTSWFSRELLEKMFADIQKNKPADKKQGA